MKKSNHIYSLLIIAATVSIFSCQKDQVLPQKVLDLPSEPFDYESIHENADPDFEGNNWFGDNTPFNNQVTNEGATLGRVLFYDQRLSQSNKTSCASCHKQEFGFADNTAKSAGFFVEETRRNSPHLINMKFENSFFWDGRETVLETQVLQPIEDHIELGMEDVEDIVEKLNELEYYPALFESAFGSTEISTDNVSKALAQFVRSMLSTNTKFDQGFEQDFNNFSSSELNGLRLFQAQLPCGGCHSGPDLGGGSAIGNIGLDIEYEDNGLGEIFNGMNGWFNVPSLRNIALTAPYMHDGRFETLEEVIDHYTQHVEDHPALSFQMMVNAQGSWDGSFVSPQFTDLMVEGLSPGEPLKFNLTNQDKQDLIAFLHTLTDTELMVDERFSNPFKVTE